MTDCGFGEITGMSLVVVLTLTRILKSVIPISY